MKILAVDDDSIILGLLREVLESAEYGEVHTCASAERALELISDATVPFDCFLVDIQMGGMDGIELCSLIRDIPRHARTPILMLTAMSEKSYIDRAFAAGATDYLSKPIDPTEIIVRLGIAEQLMRERKSLAEAAGVVDSLIEVLDRSTQYELEEAIELGKMDRLLRYPAFENYLYQSGRGTLFLSTVFAAKIRGVKELHHKLPPLEFKNLLTNAARLLIGSLSDHEVFVTYRGNGEFIGVVPRKGTFALKELGSDLVFDMEESESKHAAKLPPEVKLALGPAVPVRLPTRGELSKAVWNAVEKVRLKADPAVMQSGKFWQGRDWHPFARLQTEQEEEENSLRDEFKEMLRDQLNTGIGDLPSAAKEVAKAPKGAFTKRKGAAPQPARKKSTKLFEKPAQTATDSVQSALPGLGDSIEFVVEGEEAAGAGERNGRLRYSNA